MSSDSSPDPLFSLIVEDKSGDFDLVVHELKRAGLATRCQRVETEAEYRAHLQSEPDFILADYSLPQFNGPRALELLQQSGLDTPLIVLTGTVGEDTVVECMKRGAADYLLKDRLARLVPAVKRALEECELRRQKRRTESALRKSNDRFQHLVETTKVLPCELDLLTWRFTYVGPQAERMLGYPLDDWYAKGFWSAHVRLEDPNAIAPLCDTADFCARDHEFTCRMLAKNGKEIPFHCVVRSMAGENGARILRGFMMDISEMKAMEEALARHAEELARSNAELQQFASIASHDLQEPLRMVSFYTQLLAKRYKGKLDADADEFIGYAAEGATRMANLIRHLLEYSRVSSRKPDFAPIDCEAVFEQSLTNLQMALQESGAVVTHDPLPQVEGDATQLVQLLQNLIGNAIKFRRPEMTAQVHVAVEEKATEWIFSVRDNGIGIEQEYYDTIFAIFQQLHSRDKYEGSGVGLAICRRIVERHRGRIWVDSTPGEGTTFHFTLAKTPRKGGVNLAKTGTFGGSSDAR